MSLSLQVSVQAAWLRTVVQDSFITCSGLVCSVKNYYREVILWPVCNEFLISAEFLVDVCLRLQKALISTLVCSCSGMQGRFVAYQVCFSDYKMHFCCHQCCVLGLLFWIPPTFKIPSLLVYDPVTLSELRMWHSKTPIQNPSTSLG